LRYLKSYQRRERIAGIKLKIGLKPECSPADGSSLPLCTMEHVHELTRSVFEFIRRNRLLKPGKRVGVAVSGGLDSVGLLRLLVELRGELGVVLSVAHFNHGLRGADSDEDQSFVVELAEQQRLPVHLDHADTSTYAAQNHLSIEAGARALRYKFFRSLGTSAGLDCIATAHTLDDQAETVLLRLVRGAGTRGLAGIYPQLLFASSEFSVIRPLLDTRRAALSQYLQALGQTWREDRSNRDVRFARNRVRHGILPRLEKNLNPEVHRTLAETAEIARAEEQYWSTETGKILENGKKGSIDLAVVDNLPLALQRRVIRASAEALGLKLEFHHLAEILEAASTPDFRRLSLPQGWTLSRKQNLLKFEPPCPDNPVSYEYGLPVPGTVNVPELGVAFEAVRVSISSRPGYNPDRLFDLSALSKELTVRNWRPGDRFWPAHTKSPKKIKELLQRQHVTGWERQAWPVVVKGEEIVWLRGYPRPSTLEPRPEAVEAFLIWEKPQGV
jgi:tRNA(Ile)-lysidine synthase